MEISRHGRVVFQMLNAGYGACPDIGRITAARVLADVEALASCWHYDDVSAEERRFLANKLIRLLELTR